MAIYYISNLPITDELYHHGILGQKWGVRNGPPYPLDQKNYSKAENKGVSSNKNDGVFDSYRESKQKIKRNADGSSTIPKGFMFNRIAKDGLTSNKSGGMYVSYGKEDAARYVKNLGPSLVGKLTKEYGDTVQHIKTKGNMRIPSSDDLRSSAVDFLKKDKEAINKLDASLAFYATGLNKNVISKSDLTVREKDKLAYSLYSVLGNPNYSNEAARYYDYMRQRGFSALPDIYDRMSGTSNTALIIIDPSKVEIESKTYITKDVYKKGKKFANSLGKLPIADIFD